MSKKSKEILNEALDIIINGDVHDYTNSSSQKTSNKMTYSYENQSSNNSYMKDEISSYNYMDNVNHYDDDPDEWMSSMMKSVSFSKKRAKKKMANIFDNADGKKKKKKKVDSQGREIVDYEKQMEPEINMYRNLLKEQNAFTESLQREYDALRTTKSMSRGINKNMSDLIANITSARSLAMQLVEKNVSAKKIIAELNMKQNKELGEAGGDNMNDFAASFLKQMINERGNLIGGGVGEPGVTSYDDDSFSDMFETSIEDDSNRPDEVNKYLKYENSNISVIVSMDETNVDDYEFIAKDENGNIVSDYPLPLKTGRMSINRSTNIATDSYGKKYFIEWR